MIVCMTKCEHWWGLSREGPQQLIQKTGSTSLTWDQDFPTQDQCICRAGWAWAECRFCWQVELIRSATPLLAFPTTCVALVAQLRPSCSWRKRPRVSGITKANKTRVWAKLQKVNCRWVGPHFCLLWISNHRYQFFQLSHGKYSGLIISYPYKNSTKYLNFEYSMQCGGVHCRRGVLIRLFCSSIIIHVHRSRPLNGLGNNGPESSRAHNLQGPLMR